eukprot:1419483-Rhodomonas_salina.1
MLRGIAFSAIVGCAAAFAPVAPTALRASGTPVALSARQSLFALPSRLASSAAFDGGMLLPRRNQRSGLSTLRLSGGAAAASSVEIQSKVAVAGGTLIRCAKRSMENLFKSLHLAMAVFFLACSDPSSFPELRICLAWTTVSSML